MIVMRISTCLKRTRRTERFQSGTYGDVKLLVALILTRVEYGI